MGSGASIDAGGEDNSPPTGRRNEGPAGGRAEPGPMQGPSPPQEESTVTYKTVRRPGIATRTSSNKRDKVMRRAGTCQFDFYGQNLRFLSENVEERDLSSIDLIEFFLLSIYFLY